MRILSFFVVAIFLANLHAKTIPTCGCMTMRPCYKKMLEKLLYGDETGCIEDASLGTSTIVVFLKALEAYCGPLVKIKADKWTHGMRKLYQVTIHQEPKPKSRSQNATTTTTTTKEAEEAPESSDKPISTSGKPIIMIDAGQLGDTDSVGFALFIIEQLVACSENENLVEKIEWLILPNTNPDGLEYRRFKHPTWTKNMRWDSTCIGVDVSRNFPAEFELCLNENSPFFSHYHGAKAGSENETKFIMDAFEKHKGHISAYISLRNNGHSLLFPFSAKAGALTPDAIYNVAKNVTAKVNVKAGTVQSFTNLTIMEMNGMAVCGSSVDYAYSLSIPYTYEMRVFLDEDSKIISKFHSLPTGFVRGLRNGYFDGILELAKTIKDDKNAAKPALRRRNMLITW